jgi:hypothetical protein
MDASTLEGAVRTCCNYRQNAGIEVLKFINYRVAPRKQHSFNQPGIHIPFFGWLFIYITAKAGKQ